MYVAATATIAAYVNTSSPVTIGSPVNLVAELYEKCEKPVHYFLVFSSKI